MSDTDTQDDTPAMADEQAADLAALIAGAKAGAEPQAGAVEAKEGAQADPEELPPVSAQALAFGGLLVSIGRPLVEYAVPSLRGAPDELWMPVPEGVGAVVDSFGVAAEWMRSPWARLGLSLAPLAAFAAVEAMKQPEKPAKALEAPAPGTFAEPGAKTLTAGTVIPMAEGGGHA